MAIMVSGGTGSGTTFTPCPAGMHQLVCCDVIDNGIQQTPWGEKPKVTIRWQANEAMPDGKPYMVQKRYTRSLHEKSVLRHDLESWRGRPFSDEELKGFDLEKLIGVNGMGVVIHRKDDQGKTWANVQTLTPLVKGMAKIDVRDYVRERDRAAQAEPEPGAMADEDTPPF